MKSAAKSVDMCMAIYSYDLMDESSLVHLRDRGVEVRVIMDSALTNQGFRALPFLEKMQESGIQVKLAQQNGLMHHKFVIVDNKILINGSINWTISGFFGNYEFVYMTEDKKVLEAFNGEFTKLWEFLN